MKNLTGSGGDYQSLSRDDRNDSFANSATNPFADASNDSCSSNSNLSASHSNSSGSGTRQNGNSSQNLVAGSNPATTTPSLMSGSDLDRYPIRKSLVPPGQDQSNSSFSRYSQGQSSFKSQRTSISSGMQDENDPFLTTADSSPFGGYPANEFPLLMDEKEADDYLHNPDPIADAAEDRKCHKLDKRGWGCIIAFSLLIGGFIAVFIILPVLDFTGPTTDVPAPVEGVRLSPYRYNILKGLRTADGLIDPDTPEEAKTHKSYKGEIWELVFSDEFNEDGRTFYPGDDPVWEAVDIHYQATEDLEWYTPDAAYTEDGTLKLRMDAFQSHDLFYRSAMMQSWNKLCFTQGYVEVGARLPGNGTILGLWPGLWTLGNLARAGYLASSEGVWPYGYDECDYGITPNQSAPDGTSYLPGQRLNKCVCKQDQHMHPSPGIGRGAPEIDIIEGTVGELTGQTGNLGQVSQSLQVAPMDIWWLVDYDFIEITNHSITKMNTWTGGPIQQAVSGATFLNASWYQLSEERAFQSYGVEWINSQEDGYISWYVGGEITYSMLAGALSPNGNVGWRQVSKEPMSMVMNLGISNSWVYVDWVDLKFPAVFEIDYVRVYQPSGNISVTCDPDDYPTSDYIKAHPVAYQNSNATSWEAAGYSWPRNSFAFDCSS